MILSARPGHQFAQHGAHDHPLQHVDNLPMTEHYCFNVPNVDAQAVHVMLP